ncbi:MAG TPA: peptidyl-dipeptidase [Solibacterales bacterium]|nr:peptidyl-dipeptidase [Bryobacterales bacterium]
MRPLLLLAISMISSAAQVPTEAEARAFLDATEKQLMRLSEEAGRAQWVQSTYITHDTEILAAQANEKLAAATADLAKKAARFAKVQLPPDLARKMTLLRTSITLPAPADPKLSEEITRLVTGMESLYGKGRYCPPGKSGSECLDLQEITRIMARSRDPEQLLAVSNGWQTIAPPMRSDYRRFVEVSNQGAKELGFRDTGALWRSKYDMPPDEFAAELDRLWEQVKPLYVSLHTYVRKRLREKYGAAAVPERGAIPAHLLGNPWAQSWDNIYELVAPPDADPGFDLTEILKARKVDARGMVRYGERFFTSLGFAPLPATFWERSLFVKPADREVVCHASAWDIDAQDDLRIKMCIEPTTDDFVTIHHELGHNFYQRAYRQQPFLFQSSANDGFHEALGDTIALSITPEYLKQVKLIEQAPPAEGDIGLLMQQALDKVAFLPFGVVVDQWRWKVFSGEAKPADYNKVWWELRRKYQGVAEPNARPADAFDAGAKYHVPANVPYTRYFLAHILQFQFYRALCKQSGFTGPLHRCSFYGNQQAGARIHKMMEMGASQPWPVALEALTGQKQMDATAILDYFAPLKAWLDEQNQKLGYKAGW